MCNVCINIRIGGTYYRLPVSTDGCSSVELSKPMGNEVRNKKKKKEMKTVAQTCRWVEIVQIHVETSK